MATVVDAAFSLACSGNEPISVRNEQEKSDSMFLTMLMFSQIVSHCSANDAVEPLVSVAKIESGLNTLAIHDNTAGDNPQATDESDAARIVQQLIARRHSVDLGLMQINSGNLNRLGLSVGDAFDACRSIAAGGRILREGYQQALRVAFSRYNTGDAVRGFANGYVGRVLAASAALPPIAAQAGTGLPQAEPPPPPAPMAVLDMLHGDDGAPDAPARTNLLAGVAVSPPTSLERSVADPAQLAQAGVRRGPASMGQPLASN